MRLLPNGVLAAAAAFLLGVAGPRQACGDGGTLGAAPRNLAKGRRAKTGDLAFPLAFCPPLSLFLHGEGGKGSPALDVALRFTQAVPEWFSNLRQ